MRAMNKLGTIALAGIGMLAGLPLVLGQQPAATRVVGTVVSVDGAAGTLKVKSDQGAEVSVKVAENTRKLKIPAGETDMKKATPLELSEVSGGDRALASGTMSEDQQTLTARTIVITVKADLAAKAKAEAEEWTKRGALGLASAVDPANNTFKLKKRDEAGKLVELTVKVKDGADIKKYEGASTKYSDAKPAKLADLQVNDQVRILGDKSADGLNWTVERLVFGSYRVLAGVVKSVDAAKGEIVIDDVDSKKAVTIVVDPSTNSRKMMQMASFVLARQLNPEIATMMERFGGGQGRQGGPGGQGGAPRQGGQGGPQGAGARGPQGPQGGGGDMMGGGMGMAMPSGPMTPQQMQQLIERQPKLNIAELPVGDSVIVNAAAGKDPLRVQAISLVSGVDTILRALPDMGGVSAGLGQAGMAGVF